EWNSTLHVTPVGLTTGTIPDSDGAFQMDLDLVAHELLIVTSRSDRRTVPLRSMSVARFYRELREALTQMNVSVPKITPPNELAIAIPFHQDHDVRPYDRDAVARFADALLRTSMLFERFRAEFVGK